MLLYSEKEKCLWNREICFCNEIQYNKERYKKFLLSKKRGVKFG